MNPLQAAAHELALDRMMAENASLRNMKTTRFAQESAAQSQGMNATLRFEIKARAFHAMTGYMAPGKDAPSSLPDDYAAREAAWAVWDKSHQKIIDAMLNAVSAEIFTA